MLSHALEESPAKHEAGVVLVFLETDRLLLRRLTTSDVDDLFVRRADRSAGAG
jgi:hypothetical protein